MMRVIVICVVEVYQKMEKSMLDEKPTVYLDNLICKDLEFENLHEDEKYLWFTAFHFNGLFRMDKSEWEPQFVGIFPEEDVEGFRLYSKIIEHGDKLYFTPLRARQIAVYDKKKNSFYKISFEELEIGYLADYSGWNFYDAQLYGDSIYFFPHQRTAVLQYNVKNEELKVISAWVSEIVDKYDLIQPRVFYRTEMKDGIVYAPVSGCNLLECIDLNTKQVELHEIGRRGSTYSDICIIGTKGYICPFNGEEIIEWDVLAQKEKKALVFTKKNNEYIYFQGMCKLGKKVFVFPEYYDHVIEIDSDTSKIEKKLENVFDRDYIENYKYMNPENPTECRYTFCYESQGKIYAYCYATRRLTVYGKDGDYSKKIAINTTNKRNKNYADVRHAYVKKLFQDKKNIQIERSCYDIHDFLRCLMELPV